nr:putative ribonuclease H-like domain-containing protein [Tanacetum cinerariifolium]
MVWYEGQVCAVEMCKGNKGIPTCVGFNDIGCDKNISKVEGTIWKKDLYMTRVGDRKETEPVKYYILLPLWTTDPPFSQDPKSSHDDGFKPSSDDEKKVDKDSRQESECKDQEKKDNVNSTNNVNAAGTNGVNVVSKNISSELLFDPDMPALEDIDTFDFSNKDEDDGEMADMNNLETTIQVSPTPTTRVHKDHPLDQVTGDFHLATQTRNMSKNLEEHGFKIDKTLFIKRHKGDILLVQVYVDDIIFGLTRKELCIAFERLMHEKFQMSSMGELTFFLGLQVKQKNDGIFISQDKYIGEILMKFGFTEVRNASTPMKTQKPLLKDEDGEEVDVHMYRRDLQFGDEEGVDCLPIATIFEQLALMGKAKRKDTQVPQLSGPTESVADEAVYKELDDSLVRAATTASSLEAEQDNGGGSRCQDTMRDTIAQTRSERVSKLFNDSLLARVSTHDDAEMFDAEMFDADQDLGDEKVFVAKQDRNVVEKEVDAAQVQVSTAATTPTISIDEVTLAQALAELKHTKPMAKAKRIVFYEPEESTTTTTTIPKPKSQDKDLKQLMKIIPEEEITIDAIPLAVKSLIVDWKIYKEGKKSYYQIIRAGGKSKMYLVLSHMLKDLTKKT